MSGPAMDIIGRMSAFPLVVLSAAEVESLAQAVHTPEEIASALWDYAFVCWQRGQRFERARADDAAARCWDIRPLLAGR